MFGYGMAVLWGKPWLWDIRYCWYHYPHHAVEGDVWWYYMIELTFYWSLTFSQFYDVKRKGNLPAVISGLKLQQKMNRYENYVIESLINKNFFDRFLGDVHSPYHHHLIDGIFVDVQPYKGWHVGASNSRCSRHFTRGRGFNFI